MHHHLAICREKLDEDAIDIYIYRGRIDCLEYIFPPLIGILLGCFAFILIGLPIMSFMEISYPTWPWLTPLLLGGTVGFFSYKRTNSFRRWRLVNQTVFGQKLFKLAKQYRVVERQAKKGVFDETSSSAMQKKLRDQATKLWLAAHESLGLIVDNPEILMETDSLLSETQTLLNDRKKAEKELDTTQIQNEAR